MFTNHKVMLFCPVRLPEDQVRDMLDVHASLQDVASFVYFDDCDRKASILLRSKAPSDTTFLRLENLPPPVYSNHNWTEESVGRIAQIRNLALLHFNATNQGGAGFTHLFLVDADLFLHPETVSVLLAASQPIVSEVFWSQWPNCIDTWLPNCWDYNEHAFDGWQSVVRLREPGLYRVGGLGACTLVRADVAANPLVNYFPVPNRKQFGEDRDFCLRAAVAGYPLHMDTHRPAFHVYRPYQLEEARQWYSLGCPSSWFSERWLTEEWIAKLRLSAEPEPAKPKTTPTVACLLPGEDFCSAWVANWTNLFGHLAKRGTVLPFFAYCSNVFMTRASLWEAMRQIVADRTSPNHPDLLLWIDDDNLVTPEQLDMLMESLESHEEASAVAGWCWIQTEGHLYPDAVVSCGSIGEDSLIHPFRRTDLDNAPGNLVPVGYTGFPVILMRASMLGMDCQHPFLPILDPRYTFGMSGEDVAFCVAAGKAGHKIFVDRRVKVPHLKRQPAEPPPGERRSSLESGGKPEPSPVNAPVPGSPGR